MRADAVRSPTGLDVRDELAFEPGEIGVHREHDEKKQRDLDDRYDPEGVLRNEVFEKFDHDFACASGTDSMA